MTVRSRPRWLKPLRTEQNKKNPGDFSRDFLTLYYGLGDPQFEQNFPLFTVPHWHVQSLEGAGLPQLLQNFPVLTWPHSHVHEPAAAAGAGAGAGAA